MKGLRATWNEGGTTLGAWLSIPSTISAEAVAHIGFDYVCIDTQHGAIEYSDTVPMIQAILLGGSSPIVRVPWNEPGIIGKVLDAGAHGVIVPMINTADAARAVVAACRYAPGGSRSYGPSTAAVRLGGADYPQWAADNIAVIPMIETVEAVGNLDDILAVPGIDAVYVGPADLSVTLGLPPRNNDDDPAFAHALTTIVDGCARAGVVAGIHSNDALTPRRIDAGFRMITISMEINAMKSTLAAELAAVRGDAPARSAPDRHPHTSRAFS